jgi:hypothetical protein
VATRLCGRDIGLRDDDDVLGSTVESVNRTFLVGRASSSSSSPEFTVSGVSDLFRVRGFVVVLVLPLWSVVELLEVCRLNMPGGGLEASSSPLTGDAASGWGIEWSC